MEGVYPFFFFFLIHVCRMRPPARSLGRSQVVGGVRGGGEPWAGRRGHCLLPVMRPDCRAARAQLLLQLVLAS